MKRLKTIVGVTLLEVMLVLAIIAIIIVLSIRFYQSAQSAQQATAALAQVQSIVAAADALTGASGSYTSDPTLPADIATYLHTTAIIPPWGGTANITAPASNEIKVDWVGGVAPSPAVCVQLNGQLTAPDLAGSYALVGGATNCTGVTYTKN